MNKNTIKLMPFVKWPGGKTSEWKNIKEFIPKKIKRYFEPFVGGGAILFNLSNKNISNYYINDISEELMLLYKFIKNTNPNFHKRLHDIRKNWLLIEDIVDKHSIELIEFYFNYKNGRISEKMLVNIFESFLYKYAHEFNGMLSSEINPQIDHFRRELIVTLKRKFNRMIKLEIKRGNMPQEDYINNIETIFKSSFYTHYRYLYNNIQELFIEKEYQIAIFYFIREYCYSSMFRFNMSGEFNVPYGGMNYNRKDFTKKLNYLKSTSLKTFMKSVNLYNTDFEVFFNTFNYNQKDFIFLDPPYDSEFSEYDQNSFNRNDQIRLYNKLKNIKAKFLLVIKNTEFIFDLYKDSDFYISTFAKKYTVSFMNRNEKEVTHLLISNYKI